MMLMSPEMPNVFPVIAMVVFYWLERRSPWFILAFAVSCALGAVYEFFRGAWPFGLIEAAWSVVAVYRWRSGKKSGRSIAHMMP